MTDLVRDEGSRPWAVLVVDDDEEVRGLLELILDLDPRFEAVGSAARASSGAALAAERRPDVVILDLQMPGMHGLTALPIIREGAPDAHVVVLSAFPDPYTLLDVVSAGADAYLDKANTFAELIPTLVALCERDEAVPDPYSMTQLSRSGEVDDSCPVSYAEPSLRPGRHSASRG